MSDPTPSSRVTTQNEPQQEASLSRKAVASGKTIEEQYNLANSSDARTAQFTLISILLGIILAALLTGLPRGANTFAINLISFGLGVCLRALAVVLMAALLWLEYTWGILTRFVLATPAHNLSYFALGITVSGSALAVADFRAWLAWIAALSGVAIVSGIINRPTLRILGTDERRKWYQDKLQWLDCIELTVYVVVGILALVLTLIEYFWKPAFLSPQAQVWCCVAVVVVVAADLVMQVTMYIPRLRNAKGTPDSQA